ncbi:MAG: hypothetical protein H6756_12370 [Candidatus Omnitrophica bacterium]|nr:hypothetical protein [Candidatus Omnitrophota bacterium]
MIIVCDVNTTWRYSPFAAMAKFTDVLAFAPGDPATVLQRVTHSKTKLSVLKVLLPPGWASRTAALGQRLLWHRMHKHATASGKRIDCVVMTSPHYLTLLKLLPPDVNKVYYASDDYRSYSGWSNMVALEAEMVRRVDHSFFISEGLARRARDEYGVFAERISISMNATEARFFPTSEEKLPIDPPCGSLPRPIAGVVGGINERLDFSVLLACANLPEMGTLLLIGPLPEKRSARLQSLLAHPKCRNVGTQPHDTLHRWFKCLDVGLIPYAQSELNRFCSPMRLFDHLASGVWLVATTVCEQVHQFKEHVLVCDTPESFVESVRSRFQAPRKAERVSGITWDDRADRMLMMFREISNA